MRERVCEWAERKGSQARDRPSTRYKIRPKRRGIEREITQKKLILPVERKWCKIGIQERIASEPIPGGRRDNSGLKEYFPRLPLPCLGVCPSGSRSVAVAVCL